MRYEKIRRRTDLRSQLEIREAVRKEFESEGLPTKGGISIKSREKIEALGEIARRRWEVNVLSPEDALISEITAYKHWDDRPSFTRAQLVFGAQRDELDTTYLRERARDEKIEDALEKLLKILGI